MKSTVITSYYCDMCKNPIEKIDINDEKFSTITLKVGCMSYADGSPIPIDTSYTDEFGIRRQRTSLDYKALREKTIDHICVDCAEAVYQFIELRMMCPAENKYMNKKHK